MANVDTETLKATMANVDMVALNFDPEDDDLMDEDFGDGALKAAIASFAPKNIKGRGFRDEAAAETDLKSHMSARFDTLDSGGRLGPEQSIEGWIILVSGVHEEAHEDDLQNTFGGFGEIKNLHLNPDRRTGFIKGYALIEYEKFDEAQSAINEMDGAKLLTQSVNVDWAFCKGSFRRRSTRRRSPRTHRSRSPRRLL